MKLRQLPPSTSISILVVNVIRMYEATRMPFLPWFHAKCIGMRKNIFKYYLEQHYSDWQCSFCSLPKLSDSFFGDELQAVGNEDRGILHNKCKSITPDMH